MDEVTNLTFKFQVRNKSGSIVGNRVLILSKAVLHDLAQEEANQQYQDYGFFKFDLIDIVAEQ